jgi:hypothetical protein
MALEFRSEVLPNGRARRPCRPEAFDSSAARARSSANDEGDYTWINQTILDFFCNGISTRVSIGKEAGAFLPAR